MYIYLIVTWKFFVDLYVGKSKYKCIHISVNRHCCCCLVLSPVRLLCDPMYCSPLGSSIHEIFQARILEWSLIPFSRGSS